MWHCGVDVAYPRLSNWTRLQWALQAKQVSPLSAMRGSNVLFPNDTGEELLWLFVICTKIQPSQVAIYIVLVLQRTLYNFLCVCVHACVCALNGKWLELSILNLVHIYCMAGSLQALTWTSKGQGHMVMETIMIIWLQVKHAAVA